MIRTTFTLILGILLSVMSYGQVFLEEFDSVLDTQISVPDGYAGSLDGGEWTITGDGTGGAFSAFSYKPADADGNLTSIDVTENNKIFVRAKASSNGTELRMDIKDADGFVTSIPGITKFLVADYAVYEFDFTGVYQDGGFGGSNCEMADAPCDVDGSQIVEFVFFINPVSGGFAGSVVMDFISVGTEPMVIPMSDVFQDHFDDTTTLRFFGDSPVGFTNTIEDSQWKIKGDGTNGMWDPVSMLTFNPATLDTVDISVKNGDDKIYIRMRATVPGTSIRLDLQDINNFATTAGSVTQVISEEFATYEFNYAGSYQDLAFGGTGCEVGPCDVDSDRIANMILFVNPGVEAYAGEVHIDYISVGTPLEIIENDEVLVYGDHFENGDTYVTTSAGYVLGVSDSEFTITGDGNDAAFSAVAYNIHDMDIGGGISIDATANNKLFIKAKSTVANTLLRVDLVDTAGFVTTLPSFSRILGEDYDVLELNFTNNYIDGAYGGTSCEAGGDQCLVDGSALSTVLLYPNPADGGFNGVITIDYIAFGAPLGDVVAGAPQDLPLDFESDNVEYELSSFGSVDFGEIPAEIIDNPDASGENTSSKVVSIEKSEGAQVWAGVSMPLANSVDFSEDNLLYMKVWSPNENTPFQLKLEDTTSPPNADGNPSVIAEVLVSTTTASAWETLVFDMSTFAAFSPDSSYNQVVVFPNFGNAGTGTTYYFDNITTEGDVDLSEPQDLPIDFESENVVYDLRSFGSAEFGEIPVMRIDNPDATGENTSSKVMSIEKTVDAQTWAGVAMPLENAIGFEEDNLLYVEVWSPNEGTPFMLKLEDTNSAPNADGNPSVFAEVLVNSTVASAWENLVFDMSLFEGFSPDSSYNQVVFFPNFGNVGAGTTYYVDNITENLPAVEVQELPLSFESEEIEYELLSFGSAEFGDIPVEIIDNPDASGINTSGKVVSIEKTTGAQTWAGVALPLASAIDFSSSNLLYMHVWSPNANTAFNLKIEDTTSPPDANGNPSIFAEIVSTTTTTSAWEVLVFDMSGFSGFDASNSYDQVVVFPDFGNMGGGETFYFDNIGYEASSSTIDLVSVKDFKIAPNPFSDEAIVTWENKDNSTYQVSILTLTGQVVRNYQNVTGEALSVRKNNLIAGMYFLNFRDDKGNTGTLKMMID